MFYLAARTGPDKGNTWPVTGSGVIIGRDSACDIRVADPLASRRHCKITSDNGTLRLEDLKSSNTTLLNGNPAHEGVLRPGDEVAVGNIVFLVVGIDAPVSQPNVTRESPSDDPRTVTISMNEAVYLTDAVAFQRLGRPQTTRDLAFLFTLGRTLSTAETKSALRQMLTARLRDVFQPKGIWLALRESRSGDIEYTTEFASGQGPKARDIPQTLLESAIRENRGIIVPVAPESIRDDFSTLMVSPLCISGEPIGAVALRGVAPERTYDEADLEMLIAAAHQAAPFLVTVELVEQLRRDNERLRNAAESNQQVGESPTFTKVVDMMRRAAKSDLSILITGETGTGKELAAQFIHEHSNRRNGPFVALNCAAIPRELLESELFGHVRGAFTGADRDHTGHLEQADGGTIFLDEIGDLSRESQASILRAIETGRFRRVGAEKETRVDVRIVCATNKPLRENIEQGQFRADLFHRLAGFEVQLPPLRERASDIPVLANHYLQLFRHKAQKPLRGFSDAAMDYLAKHGWPGNIRELRSTIERAVHICPGDEIDVDDVRPFGGEVTEASEELCSMAEMERRYVERVVRRCEGNISAAARILSISRNTLYSKLNSRP